MAYIGIVASLVLYGFMYQQLGRDRVIKPLYGYCDYDLVFIAHTQ